MSTIYIGVLVCCEVNLYIGKFQNLDTKFVFYVLRLYQEILNTRIVIYTKFAVILVVEFGLYVYN